MATTTVTVLFTDLVGSTELISRVGEDTAETLRREHFALLRTAIEATGGQEVKNLGDGLMVVFSSAVDAVAAATAMQQSFQRRNRRADHDLSIRVGISLGEADREDGDYFGVPVVQAARLCAIAEGSQILTTDVVRLLSGSRGGHRFDPVGELELKGLDEPTAACRIAWEALEDDDLPPVPGRLAQSLPNNFVGRDAEHDRLSAAWKLASTGGGPQILLLSGEPGIGKTTLSARLAGQVHDEGALVVYGRCDEELGIPYQPWVEALGQIVDHAAPEVLSEHVEDRGGHVARLVPRLGQRVGGEAPPSSDSATEQFLLFDAVTDLLERVSHEWPVLLVLDDLHWADRPTLQLIRHLAMAGRPMRVAALGTFRDSDVTSGGPLSELLAALHRETGVERVALRGLADDELLTLLERIAGHEMTEDGVALRDAVLAETAGNPFFVGEMLRHLAETGAIYQDDGGRWVAQPDLRAVGLPVSVKEVVGRRLAALGPDTERILSVAAVIGRDFDVPLLAAAADADEDDVVDLCDAAVGAAVLQTTEDPDRYTFAHALIEHTLYDGLSPARRTRAHHAVAEHIERLAGRDADDRAGELARHWAAAVRPTDMDKAVHYAQVAATRALDQLAPDEALRWYTQALELVDRVPDPDPRQHTEILIGLGDAQLRCGHAEHRSTLIEAAWMADRIDAVDLLAHAALTNSRGWNSVIGAADDERIAVIDRALERLTEPDSATRAQLLSLVATEKRDVAEFEEQQDLVDEAIATVRRSGDTFALTNVLWRAAQTLRAPWALDRRRTWTDEACELADELGDPLLRWGVHDQRMLVALEQGDLALLRASEEIAGQMADQSHSPSALWARNFHLVWQTVLAGDLREAEELAEAALAFGIEKGQPDAARIFGAQLVNIRYNQGRIGEVHPLIEQALDEAPELRAYRAVLAMAYAHAGHALQAAELLEEALAVGFAQKPDNSWTTAMALWAETAVATGHGEAAVVLEGVLAPFHDQIVTTHITVQPAVAHYLGRLEHLLGRFDRAARWFEEAMALHQGLESPLLVAHTEAAWALLLADRAEGDDLILARQLAEQSLTAAEQGTYSADAREVLARLP